MASFVSVLKKIGEVIVDAAGILTGVGPLITNLIPAGSQANTVVGTAISDLTQIGSIVTTVESAFSAVTTAKTGPLKLQAAAPLVSQIIQQSALVAGHPIANSTLFNQGVTEVTQGVVDILNSLNSGGVGTQGSVPAPASTGAVPVPSATIPPALLPTTVPPTASV
jgi:hypothetical protein